MSSRHVADSDARKPEYTYSAGNGECCHDECGRFELPRNQCLYHKDWQLVATDLADDYHHNHDGWESSWPLELRIYEDDVEVARFSVEREAQPVFYAWRRDMPHSTQVEAA